MSAELLMFVLCSGFIVSDGTVNVCFMNVGKILAAKVDSVHSLYVLVSFVYLSMNPARHSLMYSLPPELMFGSALSIPPSSYLS